MALPEKLKVLVVEDDKDIEEILVEKITDICGKQSELDFATCDTVAASKALLKHNHYDLMTLDLNLVDGHANAVLEYLPETKNPEIKVIILSGSIETAEVQTSDRVIFLDKPDKIQRLDIYIKALMLS